MNKSKILSRVSIMLIMVVVFASNVFPSFAREEVDKPSALPGSSKASVRKCQSDHFFASQLDTTQEKEIYTVLENHLLSNRKISKTGTITFGEPLKLDFKINKESDISNNEAKLSELVVKELQRGVDSFKYDHPEMYWTTGGTTLTDITIGANADGVAVVMSVIVNFEPLKGDNEADDKAVAAAVNSIVTQANKYTDDYSRLKVVHDMLAQRITYEAGSKIPMRAFQITGGLVDKSGVCESYAKSFKLIAEKLGYKTILVAGTAENNGEKVPHMWNYVKVQEKWYAVDVTWDDQSITLTDYFLVGSTTKAPNFGGTTFEGTHKPEYTFHPIEYKNFGYPKLSETAFKN